MPVSAFRRKRMSPNSDLSSHTESNEIHDPSSENRQNLRPDNSSHHSVSSVGNADYSGAGYSPSDDEEDSSPLVHHRTPSTTQQPNDVAPQGANSRSSTSQNERAKPKSLLQRLASVKRPKPDFKATINPRKDRYSVLELDDVHGRPSEDMPAMDISFFEGFPSSFQPSDSLSQDKKRHTRIESDETDHAGPSDDPPTRFSLEIDPSTNKKLRSATIRRQGKDLANKTNAIVSVDKRSTAVDLSVLEGLGSPSTKTNEAPSLGKPPTALTDLSWFYPDDPVQPNWKPLPMRSFYIIMLAVVSLALAGVQEYLYQRSRQLEEKNSGLIPYNDVQDISVAEFFCWKYLPTLVTVAYGVLWQVADYEIQRLEPYHQLSQPTGNIAEKSLNLDYVTMWSYFVPYKALKYRHWTVFVSVIGTILATTAAPSLQTPSIKPAINPKCKGPPEASCSEEFKFFLRVHPVWSRLVTACLGLVAILAVILLFQLRRKSGLLSDPLGVAGVAAMANRSHIMADFQGMDESLHDDIHKKLQNRRYVLYKSTIWQGEYTETGDGEGSVDSEPGKPPNPQPIILRPVWLLAFIIFMIICLPFVPAISYVRKLNKVTHKLPWLPVLIATLIKQLWATLEFNVKMMEPFHTLTKGNARPEQTITLDYQGTPYGLILFKALFNRHWLVALVGFGAILSDLLTVTFSSLSVTTETPQSFYSSSVISTAIVIFMIFSAILIFIRRRRPFMPRQPSTIASILAFIHQSRMLEDFTGTELFTNSQMQEMLVAKNKRYGLGWFKGRDDRPHCAIDQEPMLSRYVHGASYIRATAPWEENV